MMKFSNRNNKQFSLVNTNFKSQSCGHCSTICCYLSTAFCRV